MKYDYKCPIEVDHEIPGDMTVAKLKEGVVFETPYLDMFITKEEVAKLVDDLQAWLIKGAEMPPVV